MMGDGNTKKVFKWFTIPQYRQEEEFLSDMHKRGWKFTKVVFPGFYYFEKCKPASVSYRLDYNQEGIAHKAEYVQMFSDCGWEYLFDFVGYSYFRKQSEEIDESEEIFCDDESRLDMMKRVYKGRIVPLIIIFFCIILPQLVMNTHGYGSAGVAQDVLSGLFVVMGILYLSLFSIFTKQFYEYEKMINPENKPIKKYMGIYLAIMVCFLGIAGTLFFRLSSDYQIDDKQYGFVMEAERLNKTVTREYSLKKGDVVEVTHQAEDGSWYIEIAKDKEEPVFYGNTSEEFEKFSVEVQEDGVYKIVCRGRGAKGTIAFEIK